MSRCVCVVFKNLLLNGLGMLVVPSSGLRGLMHFFSSFSLVHFLFSFFHLFLSSLSLIPPFLFLLSGSFISSLFSLFYLLNLSYIFFSLLPLLFSSLIFSLLLVFSSPSLPPLLPSSLCTPPSRFFISISFLLPILSSVSLLRSSFSHLLSFILSSSLSVLPSRSFFPLVLSNFLICFSFPLLSFSHPLSYPTLTFFPTFSYITLISLSLFSHPFVFFYSFSCFFPRSFISFSPPVLSSPTASSLGIKL